MKMLTRKSKRFFIRSFALLATPLCLSGCKDSGAGSEVPLNQMVPALREAKKVSEDPKPGDPTTGKTLNYSIPRSGL